MAAHSGTAFGDLLYERSGGRIRGVADTWQFTSIDTVGDISSPTLTLISPTPGSTIAPSTPLVAQIEDNAGFSLREIWAKFGAGNAWELVHDGSAFVAPYTVSSIETELGTPGPGYYDRRTYTVRRTGGWPSSASSVLLRFSVVDSAGNGVVLSS